MKSKVKIYAALGLGLDLGRTGVYFEDIRMGKVNASNTFIVYLKERFDISDNW